MFLLYEDDYGQEVEVGVGDSDSEDGRLTSAVLREAFIADGEDVDNVQRPSRKMIKTLTPSSEQLASFNLTAGENIVTFTVHSRL